MGEKTRTFRNPRGIFRELHTHTHLRDGLFLLSTKGAAGEFARSNSRSAPGSSFLIQRRSVIFESFVVRTHRGSFAQVFQTEESLFKDNGGFALLRARTRSHRDARESSLAIGCDVPAQRVIHLITFSLSLRLAPHPPRLFPSSSCPASQPRISLLASASCES